MITIVPTVASRSRTLDVLEQHDLSFACVLSLTIDRHFVFLSVLGDHGAAAGSPVGEPCADFSDEVKGSEGTMENQIMQHPRETPRPGRFEGCARRAR